MKKLLTILIFISCISIVVANVPNYRDEYVNDFAGVFSQEQFNSIRNLFFALDNEIGAEFVVVTDLECASKGGQSQYATDIFNSWRVGKSDKDNGLLILYCKEEDKIWVTTGYGLEGILPDSKIGRLLDESFVVYRGEGDSANGILAFAIGVAKVADENREEIMSTQENYEYNFVPGLIFILVIFFSFGLLVYFLTNRRRRGIGDFFVFLFIDFLFRMILFSLISGGRGSSRGGFGGGRSGGGGAGR